MERLLADAEKLTGIHYDIDNLADVYNAVHAIQEEIGITGTTILEAEETFTGSLNAMRAATKNVLGDLALGEDLTESMNALGETVATFLMDNLLPMIGRILSGLPSLVAGFFSAIVPKIIEKIPDLLAAAKEAMVSMLQKIKEHLPEFLHNGAEFIKNLARGFIDNLPVLLSSAGKALVALIGKIVNAIPELISSGIKLLGGLGKGLIDAIPKLLEVVPKIIKELVAAFGRLGSHLVEAGKQLMSGLAQGIKNGVRYAVDAAAEGGKKLLNKVTSVFKIRSPSKVMEWMGEMLNLGLAEGIENSTKPVSKAMGSVRDIATGTFTANVTSGVKMDREGLGAVVTLLQKILEKDQDVYIDGKEAGRLLTPYVSRELVME